MDYNGYDGIRTTLVQNQLMFINRVSFTTLNMEMTWTTNRKAACRRSTQVEVVIEEEVTQYMSKLMKRPCNEKLMI